MKQGLKQRKQLSIHHSSYNTQCVLYEGGDEAEETGDCPTALSIHLSGLFDVKVECKT